MIIPHSEPAVDDAWLVVLLAGQITFLVWYIAYTVASMLERSEKS